MPPLAGQFAARYAGLGLIAIESQYSTMASGSVSLFIVHYHGHTFQGEGGSTGPTQQSSQFMALYIYSPWSSRHSSPRHRRAVGTRRPARACWQMHMRAGLARSRSRSRCDPRQLDNPDVAFALSWQLRGVGVIPVEWVFCGC